MTKKQIRKFFNQPQFEYENSVWWRGDVGYLLFDRSLLTLYGRNTDRPSLLLIQKLRGIPFIVLEEKRGVIVGIKDRKKNSEC